ncbi:MAG: hypothetical protein ACRD1G_17265 [Acidimicrobiales bacterium]
MTQESCVTSSPTPPPCCSTSTARSVASSPACPPTPWSRNCARSSPTAATATQPIEIEKSDDPFEVLAYAASLGEDEARYVNAAFTAH